MRSRYAEHLPGCGIDISNYPALAGLVDLCCQAHGICGSTLGSHKYMFVPDYPGTRIYLRNIL